MESQWWGRRDLEELRAVRLSQLLAAARSGSVFWHERLERHEVLDPAEQLARIGELPLLTRPDVQAHRDRIAKRPPAELIKRSTGGSTSQPVQLYSDRDSEARRLAATYRGYSWAGLGPGVSQLYLWGLLPRRARLTTFAGARAELFHLFHGRVPFSLFELSADRLHSIARLARTWNVVGMTAFTGAAIDLARLVASAGVDFPTLESVIVGAEKLEPEQRSYVEATLNTTVFETYGSREFMLIAAECPEAHNLHLTAEHHIVEIVDEDGRPVQPGVVGQVALTDLTNLSFPFIRYLNGDLAALSSSRCTCGRGLPVIERISGRVSDVLVTTSGVRISGLLFPHHLRDATHVARYQVRELRPDHWELLVVPTAGFEDSELNPVRAAVRTLDRGQVQLATRVVDHIPRLANGKYQLVVPRAGATGSDGGSA